MKNFKVLLTLYLIGNLLHLATSVIHTHNNETCFETIMMERSYKCPKKVKVFNENDCVGADVLHGYIWEKRIFNIEKEADIGMDVVLSTPYLEEEYFTMDYHLTVYGQIGEDKEDLVKIHDNSSFLIVDCKNNYKDCGRNRILVQKSVPYTALYITFYFENINKDDAAKIAFVYFNFIFTNCSNELREGLLGSEIEPSGLPVTDTKTNKSFLTQSGMWLIIGLGSFAGILSIFGIALAFYKLYRYRKNKSTQNKRREDDDAIKLLELHYGDEIHLAEENFFVNDHDHPHPFAYTFSHQVNLDQHSSPSLILSSSPSSSSSSSSSLARVEIQEPPISIETSQHSQSRAFISVPVHNYFPQAELGKMSEIKLDNDIEKKIQLHPHLHLHPQLQPQSPTLSLSPTLSPLVIRSA